MVGVMMLKNWPIGYRKIASGRKNLATGGKYAVNGGAPREKKTAVEDSERTEGAIKMVNMANSRFIRSFGG